MILENDSPSFLQECHFDFYLAEKAISSGVWLEWHSQSVGTVKPSSDSLDYKVSYTSYNNNDSLSAKVRNVSIPRLTIKLVRKSERYFKECILPVSLFVVASWVGCEQSKLIHPKNMVVMNM